MVLINSLTRCTSLYPRLTCRNKWRIFSRTFPRLSFNSQIRGSHNQTFSAIFSFPYIRAISVVNRLKLYQFSATAFAIPLSIGVHLADIVPELHVTTISVGLAGCISFYAAGIVCTDVIGAVYVSEHDNSVKISYADFWGKRIDAVCSISDVGALSEPGKGLTKMYQFVEIHSLKKNFKISIEKGEILDLIQFERVFFKTKTNLQKLE